MKAIKNGFVLSVLGAVLLGAVLGYLIFGSGGSNTTTPRGPTLQVSLRRGIYPALGLALEQPTSWLASTQGELVTLASPDAGLTSVLISAPAPAGNDAKLRPVISSQLLKTFHPAKVIAREAGKIGKTPAVETAILSTNAGKPKVLILSTAVSSAYKTYSIQVLFRNPHPTRQSLLEVRNMLASIRFFAPTA